jgi:hypothetical protein
MAALPQPEAPPQGLSSRKPRPKPVHPIRYMHGARFLLAPVAERHGRAVAKSARSMLWSLLLACDAMPGVMNRLRGDGWVLFWTSQLVELSGEAERTQRRLRSVLREVGALEERHLTSGQIAMRFCFTKLLEASPAIVGAPDDDVTVREPERHSKAATAAGKGSASLADIRPYGAPELQTLSTTGTGAPARVREAAGEAGTQTNDLRIPDPDPEQIDREPERSTTSVDASTGAANATSQVAPQEPLSKADRELVAGVLQAFSKHPSVERLAQSHPLRTQAAQDTARRVATMIREGVSSDALAVATTQHLDAMCRQTGAGVWSPTYCERAYDRLHSDWTMRRAQQRRLRDERERRASRATELREEVVDAAVVDDVMARYRRSTPASETTRPADDGATTREELRREIDALIASRGAPHAN